MHEYPRDFATEIHCPTQLLCGLSRLFPFGADIMGALTEDFRAARGGGTAAGTRSEVTFPSRYVCASDSATSAISVTLRRRGGAIPTWSITAVGVGDQGICDFDDADMDRTSLIGEGPWADLAGAGGRRVELVCAHPRRALAEFAYIDDKDGLCRDLAALAKDEGWGHRMLADHLALTLARTMAQDRLAISADGSSAMLDTRLLTDELQPICLSFEATEDDIPWRATGIALQASIPVRRFGLIRQPMMLPPLNSRGRQILRSTCPRSGDREA